MFFLDSKLTITCRGSSLIKTNEVVTEVEQQDDFDSASIQLPATSTRNLLPVSPDPAPERRVESELVTLLFESMLEYIVDSWTVLETKGVDNSLVGNFQASAPSEIAVASGKRKKGKSAKEKPAEQPAASSAARTSWWSGPDELVEIIFINGNTYEGNISMKCMNGRGKFQWASGTSYMGDFYYNKLCGKGTIEWRNQTWYEGDFSESLRHGYGMFVNSREQLCYIGNWQSGTKNGTGTIYYSNSSLYEGSWTRNIRQGFGAREYCAISGYKGNWEEYNRNGRGIMIWPNHDFYCGEWTDGVMDGHGTYVWSVHRNDTMSMSSQMSYKGYWKSGLRHGHGIVRFGFVNGSHYKGQFFENKKHGKGSLVTGDGTVLQSKELFNQDNLPSAATEDCCCSYSTSDESDVEPQNYSMSTDHFDVCYHVNKAAKEICSRELLQKVIDIYILSNQKRNKIVSNAVNGVNATCAACLSERYLKLDIDYKELQKAIDCYEMELKHIYYKYATLCNSTEITFTPLLIRFYMWQFYYDCKINLKGLTLVEVDEMLYRNPSWLIKNRHDPFETIFYWQFLHSVIAVAMKLYFTAADQCDTVFRKFMMEDVIPNFRKITGLPRIICAENISLKAAYKLYQSIGEPHTIREFLRAVRYPPHWINVQQLATCTSETTPQENNDIPRGRNMFTIENEPHFFFEKKSLYEKPATKSMPINNEMKLFILEVLSSKAIIQIFAQMFPQILVKDDILDLGVKLTFSEFYEVLLISAQAASVEIRSGSKQQNKRSYDTLS